jgi:hypothetical protein
VRAARKRRRRRRPRMRRKAPQKSLRLCDSLQGALMSILVKTFRFGRPYFASLCQFLHCEDAQYQMQK